MALWELDVIVRQGTRRIDRSENNWCRPDPERNEEIIRQYLCSGCRAWRAEVPYQPVHAKVQVEPTQLMELVGVQLIMWRALAQQLAPYGRGIHLGGVKVSGRSESLAEWVTIIAEEEELINWYRGAESRHQQCSDCGRIKNAIGWASMAVLSRSLDGRGFYLGGLANTTPIIDDRLIDPRQLCTKFSLLKAKRVRVIHEPLDGETLPGDPGWDGALIRNPSKSLPPDLQ